MSADEFNDLIDEIENDAKDVATNSEWGTSNAGDSKRLADGKVRVKAEYFKALFQASEYQRNCNIWRERYQKSVKLARGGWQEAEKD